MDGYDHYYHYYYHTKYITQAVFPALATVLQREFDGQSKPELHGVAEEAEVGGRVVMVQGGVVRPPHVPQHLHQQRVEGKRVQSARVQVRQLEKEITREIQEQ